MQLDDIVPWGRSFAEYTQIFQLTDSDLKKHILGCGDGPASFNAELTQKGGKVISIDPIYQFSKTDIKNKINKTCLLVLSEVEKNHDNFIWQDIQSVEQLKSIRLDAMNRFLDDYIKGKKERRYQKGALPTLSFAPGQFDLALCSHYLFLYSDHLSQAYHIHSIIELLRIAREVRIYPLVTLKNLTSKYVEPVCKELSASGFHVEINETPYRFQKNATRMLKVTRN